MAMRPYFKIKIKITEGNPNYVQICLSVKFVLHKIVNMVCPIRLD